MNNEPGFNESTIIVVLFSAIITGFVIALAIVTWLVR